VELVELLVVLAEIDVVELSLVEVKLVVVDELTRVEFVVVGEMYEELDVVD
jgi:hypothetical protein